MAEHTEGCSFKAGSFLSDRLFRENSQCQYGRWKTEADECGLY